jgi:hypothetical protein
MSRDSNEIARDARDIYFAKHGGDIYDAVRIVEQALENNEAARDALALILAAWNVPDDEDRDVGEWEWCSNNVCERPACHRCFPQSGCQEHHKCSKMTWES